ncbi:MAG: DUF1289 domain-containing protein [Betaproteobacteria bacterium]|nr:DUF1289 domain-containing protein [Betaproteobacteria bacterium]
MIASPCVKTCAIDPVTGWCLGCVRDLDEIAGWSAMTDAQKQAVLERIAVRRASLPATSGFAGQGAR